MKIILSGSIGKMGKSVAKVVKLKNNCEIVIGIDRFDKKFKNFNVVSNFNKIDKKADVLIDFSHPSMINLIINFCIKKNIPAVICTTGFSEIQNKQILKASKKIPIFKSENMSIGINLVKKICKKATKILGEDFDIEIIERHHKEKIDAPSGTALILANSISSVKQKKQKYIYDRSLKRKKRDKNEIGISCIRGGTMAGDHEVIYAGDDEIISIRHIASSREIFARSAVNAAFFITKVPPGFYDMSDLIDKI